jgi:hypothetical protein
MPLHRAAKFRWLKTWTLLAPLVHSFRIVPDHFRKKFFSEQINIGDPPPPPPPPPPSPKKFRSVYHFRGQKKFSGTIHCQYCPIFTRILHDYLYFNNKLRSFSLFCFFISHFTNTYGFSFERTDNIFANCIFVRIREIFKTNRETWRSARKPGDSRVNRYRETWQLCLHTSKSF